DRKRNGAEQTAEPLAKAGDGPEVPPHSIIVTPDGVEGAVPAAISEASAGATSPNGGPAGDEPADAPARRKEPARRNDKTKRGAKGAGAKTKPREKTRKA